MKYEHIQLLRDPMIQPTSEVIAQALGGAYAAFDGFINTLSSHKIDLKWNYYHDGKAWLAKGMYQWLGERGGKKQITVFWLAIYAGFFRVTLFFPEKTRTYLHKLSLESTVMEMISTTSQMGKLKFFPITFDLKSEEKFASILMLIEFKKNMK